MAVKKQLTVFLENKPGQLAKVCKALSKAKVNIIAISVVDSSDTGAVRLLADNSLNARKALSKLKLLIHSKDVVVVTLPNEPGALAKTAEKLYRAGINIDYAYGSAMKGSKEGICVFGVENPKKVDEVLKN